MTYFNSIEIPAFTEAEIFERFGKYEADKFLTMFTSRLSSIVDWRDGVFTFKRPINSKKENTLEEDAKITYNGLFDELVKVCEYNLLNEKN